VIGIPTLAATDPELGGSAPGIGFAIPSNLVKDLAKAGLSPGDVIRSMNGHATPTVDDLASVASTLHLTLGTFPGSG
jgi:S1-C subfamily serine protease